MPRHLSNRHAKTTSACFSLDFPKQNRKISQEMKKLRRTAELLILTASKNKLANLGNPKSLPPALNPEQLEPSTV